MRLFRFLGILIIYHIYHILTLSIAIVTFRFYSETTLAAGMRPSQMRTWSVGTNCSSYDVLVQFIGRHISSDIAAGITGITLPPDDWAPLLSYRVGSGSRVDIEETTDFKDVITRSLSKKSGWCNIYVMDCLSIIETRLVATRSAPLGAFISDAPTTLDDIKTMATSVDTDYKGLRTGAKSMLTSIGTALDNIGSFQSSIGSADTTQQPMALRTKRYRPSPGHPVDCALDSLLDAATSDLASIVDIDAAEDLLHSFRKEMRHVVLRFKNAAAGLKINDSNTKSEKILDSNLPIE